MFQIHLALQSHALRAFLYACIICSLLLLPFSVASQSFFSKQFIVKQNSELVFISPQEMSKHINKNYHKKVSFVRNIALSGHHVFRYEQATSKNDIALLIAQLKTDKHIEFVEPDSLMTYKLAPNDAL